jgi:hypothetical protein
MRAVLAACSAIVLATVALGSSSRGLFAANNPNPAFLAPPARAYAPLPGSVYAAGGPGVSTVHAGMPVAYVVAAGAAEDRGPGGASVSAGMLALGALVGGSVGYLSQRRAVFSSSGGDGPITARAPSPRMQERGDDPTQIKGISNVLGGGKKEDEVEKNPVVVAGSLIAFLLTLGGLTFGAVNPDAVEEIAKGAQKKCTADKIVNGRKVACLPDGKYEKPAK